MKPSLRLETNRLLLRPFDISDAADVQRLAGDRAIADTTQNIPHPYEDGVAEEWISTHGEIHESSAGMVLAITLRSTGEFIGAVGLSDMKPGHLAELGYWIGKPYWNQGYCTEAACAVVEHAFSTLGLKRIYARHLTRNAASGRVMQKIGMKREGCLRQHAQKWGKLEDVAVYGILMEEWRP